MKLLKKTKCSLFHIFIKKLYINESVSVYPLSFGLLYCMHWLLRVSHSWTHDDWIHPALDSALELLPCMLGACPQNPTDLHSISAILASKERLLGNQQQMCMFGLYKSYMRVEMQKGTFFPYDKSNNCICVKTTFYIGLKWQCILCKCFHFVVLKCLQK